MTTINRPGVFARYGVVLVADYRQIEPSCSECCARTTPTRDLCFDIFLELGKCSGTHRMWILEAAAVDQTEESVW